MALAEIVAVSGLAGISCNILPGPYIIDSLFCLPDFLCHQVEGFSSWELQRPS